MTSPVHQQPQSVYSGLQQPAASHSQAWGPPEGNTGQDEIDSNIIIGEPPHHLYIYDQEYEIGQEDEAAVQDPWSITSLKPPEIEEEETPPPKEPDWQGTYQAAAAEYIFVSPEQKPSSSENVALFNEGLHVVDKMIEKKPFKETLQKFNRVVMHVIFFLNVCVALADIIVGPEYLQYKVTCFVFGVIENILLVGVWAIGRLVEVDKETWQEKYGCLGKAAAKLRNFMIKYTQHFENVLHELLLYPLIIFMVVGVATEKSYQFENQEILTSISMVLIFIDLLQLIYTYVGRLLMVQKLIRDLKRDVPSIRKIRIGIIPVVNAFYANLVMNTLVFVIMLMMLYLQVMYENSESEDYSIHGNALFMIVCVIVIPIYNIIMFCLVNYFIVLELLIKINVRFVKKRKFKDKVDDHYEKEYGDVFVKAIETARMKIVSTQERLNLIQRMPVRKKLLYGLSEWWITLMLIIWCATYTIFYMCFTVDHHGMIGEIVSYVYIGVLFVGNPQMCVLVEVVDMFLLSYIFLGIYGFYKSFGKFFKANRQNKEQEVTVPCREICFDSFCKESCFCFGVMDDEKSQDSLKCCCCSNKGQEETEQITNKEKQDSDKGSDDDESDDDDEVENNDSKEEDIEKQAKGKDTSADETDSGIAASDSQDNIPKINSI